jgi:predicted DNA-binding transcriptional regulator YafY
MHHTQKILIDNEEELRISLKIFITFDFVQEILSFGDSIKVLQPQELIEDLKTIYKNALKQYCSCV